MELSHLPLEIQLMIMRALDYKSLLNFSATGKAFHDIFLHENKNLLTHALLDVEESRNPPSLNSTCFTNGGRTPFLPCYGCHTLLLGFSFTREDWCSTSTRKGPNAFSRRCLTCQAKGKYRFTRHSRLLDAPSGGEDNVYCGGCKLVMHTAPPQIVCRIYEHSDQTSFVGLQASVPKEFRCVFCRAKARGEKWPTEQQFTVYCWAC
ncbi:hypothetical protein GJ744_011548 [Endocarpon pusillum]|uniref:F-box domain-containing protein n=1 Tax=Endocarpon pusillum TaxID=364733 RepID=A0A8H7AGG9_9EURO|nr:hypothetical protein GJ744_011548 [Endocarpon pusillum]